MHFSTDFVRRLGSSKFNYWFGYVANFGLVLWLLSHAWTSSGPLGTLSFVGHAAAGLLLWTLAEYLLHRFVYHVIPSFLSVGHDLHHKEPRALIGVPWWLTSVLLVGLYQVLAWPFDGAKTGVVMAFAWLGYIGYCLAHHGSHHWRMPAGPLRAMKRHHQLHHAFPDKNWGFTTTVWDHVFGTFHHATGARKKASRRDQTVSC